MTFKNWFRNNFLAGVLVLVPVLGTVALFFWLFHKVTGPAYNWLAGLLENTFLEPFLKGKGGRFLFRLVTLFLMLGVTVIFGALTRNFVGRRVVRLGETLFEKLPVVNRVHKALKQISEAFWGHDKTVFREVVAVEYPRRGVYTIGLVTSLGRGERRERTGEDLINVLLLTTPNPTSGYLVIVPEKDTVRLDMTVEDALKMIISGGAVVPQGFKTGSILAREHREERKTPQKVELSTTEGG